MDITVYKGKGMRIMWRKVRAPHLQAAVDHAQGLGAKGLPGQGIDLGPFVGFGMIYEHLVPALTTDCYTVEYVGEIRESSQLSSGIGQDFPQPEAHTQAH